MIKEREREGEDRTHKFSLLIFFFLFLHCNCTKKIKNFYPFNKVSRILKSHIMLPLFCFLVPFPFIFYEIPFPVFGKQSTNLSIKEKTENPKKNRPYLFSLLPTLVRFPPLGRVKPGRWVRLDASGIRS